MPGCPRAPDHYPTYGARDEERPPLRRLWQPLPSPVSRPKSTFLFGPELPARATPTLATAAHARRRGLSRKPASRADELACAPPRLLAAVPSDPSCLSRKKFRLATQEERAATLGRGCKHGRVPDRSTADVRPLRIAPRIRSQYCKDERVHRPYHCAITAWWAIGS